MTMIHVECFHVTLDGRVVASYHNLLVNSIQNWAVFKRIFHEKFVEDKTPAMLLKELGSFKMEQKEKVKYFNQRFNSILNKYTKKTNPHNSIIVNYYMSTLSTSIAQFFKRDVKPILLENFQGEISLEKDLHAIGFIVVEYLAEDSKDMGRRYQAIVNKEKEASEIQILTHLVKSLTTKVFELKEWMSEKTMNNRSPRFVQKKNSSLRSDIHPAKTVHNSNLFLSLDVIVTDHYCKFHSERHLENNFPRWNHEMSTLATQLID